MGYTLMRYMHAMDAHEMHTREMQPRKIYTYGMHAREIYTRKYMLMGCTSEITALIFPKVYLKLVNDKPLSRRGVRWHTVGSELSRLRRPVVPKQSESKY
jgi:hypothetical protein